MEWLTTHGISYLFLKGTSLSQFNPSQEEYDETKVAAIAANPGPATKKAIVVSCDQKVLDGHHRYRGLLRNDPGALGLVLFVNLVFPALLAVANQYLDDTKKTINRGMLTFKEWRERPEDLDSLFEQFLVEAAKKDPSEPTKPGDVGYGDPGYVLRHLKSVPIHTKNVKTLQKTGNTLIGTSYDKIKPTDFTNEESGAVPGDTDETSGIGATGVREASTANKTLRTFDKTRVLAGKKPIFHGQSNTPKEPVHHLIKPGEDKGWKKADWPISEASNEPPNIQRLTLTQEELVQAHNEERQVWQASRTASVTQTIKDKLKKGEMSWKDAHAHLLKTGLSVGDVAKHIGEEEQPDPKNDKVSKVVAANAKGKTLTGQPKDTVDTAPTLDPLPQGTGRPMDTQT